MSRLVFQESYIVVIPSFDKTDMHKHPFMHLFFGRNSCKITAEKNEIQGNIILLDSNVKHIVKEGNGCDFFLLIDPTSTIAEQLCDQYLQNSFYYNITGNIENVPRDFYNLSDKEVAKAIEKILLDIGVSIKNVHKKDSRVEQVISNIISGDWLNYSVKKIAESAFLSESRLTHLFKEEVGISLKSYILIRKMECAYRFVSLGGKITHAAQEGGFASSAHLAYTCKTLTGVSITEVLKSEK